MLKFGYDIGSYWPEIMFVCAQMSQYGRIWQRRLQLEYN